MLASVIALNIFGWSVFYEDRANFVLEPVSLVTMPDAKDVAYYLSKILDSALTKKMDGGHIMTRGVFR